MSLNSINHLVLVIRRSLFPLETDRIFKYRHRLVEVCSSVAAEALIGSSNSCSSLFVIVGNESYKSKLYSGLY
jgi:hypothetical protein